MRQRQRDESMTGVVDVVGRRPDDGAGQQTSAGVV